MKLVFYIQIESRFYQEKEIDSMKLSSIKNGEHFIYNGVEYEKLFGGSVSSAKNLTTNESETFFGKNKCCTTS